VVHSSNGLQDAHGGNFAGLRRTESLHPPKVDPAGIDCQAVIHQGSQGRQQNKVQIYRHANIPPFICGCIVQPRVAPLLKVFRARCKWPTCVEFGFQAEKRSFPQVRFVNNEPRRPSTGTAKDRKRRYR
jgi:hypothetical protein